MHVVVTELSGNRAVMAAVDGPKTAVSVIVVSRLGIVVIPSYPTVLVPTTVVAAGLAPSTETGSVTGKNPEIVISWLAVNVE